MFNNKKNIIYLAIASIIIILVGIFLLSKKDQRNDNRIDANQENSEQKSEELTPEEVLEDMDNKYTIVLSEDSDLSINSPKEETFVVGQARMWEGTITGIEHGIFKTNCKWNFYMNDSLYKNWKSTSSASVDDNTTCGFTSTLIDMAGGLEVKLTVEILDSDENIVKTYSTNRNYTVL
jgi:hypothetical protein